MSRRTVKIRKLRSQQKELTAILPAKAVSDGRKGVWSNGRRATGIASGAVGTVAASKDTIARWTRVWGPA